MVQSAAKYNLAWRKSRIAARLLYRKAQGALRPRDQILARKLIKPGSPEVENRLVHSAGATVMYEWTAWRDEAYKPLDSVIFIGLTLSDDFIGLGLVERVVRVAAALKERRREGQRH